MPAEMEVVPNVPIAMVGMWAASTGEWDATRRQLEDAVAASSSMEIRLPRIYIDSDPHPEERISGENPDYGLSVGWAENMRLKGDTLYADFRVPPLIAETMHAHFPSRSLEGRTGVVAASGKRYEFVVDGIQLLSTHLPAVSTLEDIAELWGMTPPREAVAASSGTSGSRLIVCALTGAATPASAGTDNPRQEAPMPTPAPAEEPKTPAPDPKADQPKGPTNEPKTEPKADAPREPAKAEQPKADPDASSSGLVIPEGFSLIEDGTLAEMKAQLAEVPGLVAARRKTDAEEYLDNLVHVKRSIAASSVPKLTEKYIKDPEGTRAICDLMPEGMYEPPPTGRVAATRADDTNGDEAFDENGRLKPEYRTRTPHNIANQAS